MTADSRTAIANLIYEYAARIDAGDFDGVGRLFEHASYRSVAGGHYEGAASVRDILQQKVLLYDGTPRTKHVTTNLIVEVDAAAGTAMARSYFTVFQAISKLPLQPIVCGRYDDRFVRAAGTWRFADRLITVDLAGDLSRHLRA